MQSPVTRTSETGAEPLLPRTGSDPTVEPGGRESRALLPEAGVAGQPQDNTPEDGTETVVQPLDPEPETETGSEGMGLDLDATPDEPRPDPASDGGSVGRSEKANEGRRYLSCMKTRRDPLLMDMPPVAGSGGSGE